ncbi:MAG: extracellular solute-binding protein [Lachnospiraceae bacterium]
MEFRHYDWKKQNYIASAYGITHNGFYLDGDNHVRFSRIQPEYKAYLEQLNMWYQEGYITSDFLTATKQDAQKVFQSGNAGMTVGGNWETMTLNAVGKVANPEFDVIGVPYPRLKEDDILNYAKPLESINDKAYFISATCEHPVEAIRFMDYWYSEGARLLTAWGPGNEEYPTFDIVDGKRKVSTFMTDNPEYDYSIARDRFTLNNFQAMFDNEMEKQQYEPYPEKMETWENWAYNTTSDFRVPEMITPTVDENRELSSIMTAIDTYTDEMILKFIVGNEPLDNFNTFAETVKTMEIDRAIEIQQAAVDRYFAR